MNTAMLTLRVVPLSDVLLHEHIEKKRVARLVENLSRDENLKNPPIVTESNGKYILLDGATRVTALRQLGCRDVVVQIVDYDSPDIVLETWNHMLLDAPTSDLFAAWQCLPGLELMRTTETCAQNALETRASVGTVFLDNGMVFALNTPDNGHLVHWAQLLNGIVASYDGRGEMYRVAHTDVEQLIAEHGRLSALIVFPRFCPEEIRKLALNGSKLPMGITRHIIPGRALRINIPLDLLFADAPLEQKNAQFDEWMQTRLRERHVRYYQEPVFLFDE